MTKSQLKSIIKECLVENEADDQAIRFTFNHKDRQIVNAIANLMMKLNTIDGKNANQDSTFGMLSLALKQYVLNQTGADISRGNINYGGNKDYAADVEAAVQNVKDNQNHHQL